LEDRVKVLDGTFSIGVSPDGGTALRAALPLRGSA
jgi:signal transduction histidine kinase